MRRKKKEKLYSYIKSLGVLTGIIIITKIIYDKTKNGELSFASKNDEIQNINEENNENEGNFKLLKGQGIKKVKKIPKKIVDSAKKFKDNLAKDNFDEVDIQIEETLTDNIESELKDINIGEAIKYDALDYVIEEADIGVKKSGKNIEQKKNKNIEDNKIKEITKTKTKDIKENKAKEQLKSKEEKLDEKKIDERTLKDYVKAKPIKENKMNIDSVEEDVKIYKSINGGKKKPEVLKTAKVESNNTAKKEGNKNTKVKVEAEQYSNLDEKDKAYNVSVNTNLMDKIINIKKQEENESKKKDENVINLESIQKIKGNINSRGQKIYHVPGGKSYEITKAEYFFDTEEEAQNKGFRPSKR